MQLLTPEDIKQEKSKTADEIRRTLGALQAEESASRKRINNLHDEEKKTKLRIEAESSVEEVSALTSQKESLLSEVAQLEDRKNEALKPVRELERQSQAKLDENIATSNALADKKAVLDDQRDTMLERLDAISDKEQDIAERSASLDRRERGIAGSEAEVKRSTIELENKWVDFYKTVAEREANLESREKSVIIETKANEYRAEELDNVAKQQSEKDREIQDRYETLRRATQEFEEKQNHG